MRRVLPEGRFVRLDQSHRIFDSFFRIENIDASCTRCPTSAELLRHLRGQRSVEAADGRRQLRQRRAGYWEWSGQGLFPFDASNDAYKLGVNYLIYGMTH